MCIEKCRLIPSERRVFEIELDVAGTKVLVAGVLMESKHEVPRRFDPVDTIVFMLDTRWVPKSKF